MFKNPKSPNFRFLVFFKKNLNYSDFRLTAVTAENCCIQSN